MKSCFSELGKGLLTRHFHPFYSSFFPITTPIPFLHLKISRAEFSKVIAVVTLYLTVAGFLCYC